MKSIHKFNGRSLLALLITALFYAYSGFLTELFI